MPRNAEGESGRFGLLNWALCLIHKNQQVAVVDFFGISFRYCRQFNIVFRCLMKRQCIWRCKF
nr:DUF3709 domain-containing protein [Vibrio sp. ZOR0018]